MFEDRACVRRIQMDNGGDFVSEALLHRFRERGTRPEYFFLYYPESNRRADIPNMNLLDKTLVMISRIGYDNKGLWAAAVSTERYIRKTMFNYACQSIRKHRPNRCNE